MRVSLCRGALLVFPAMILAGFVAPRVLAQSAGPNVNMVSGTGWTNGDPFLQRQNEPTIAVSTRNTLHLVAGANDYRGVDIPGLLGSTERGDAWLGLFKSFDGGQTWQSTLLPGYPLDQSKEPNGLPSPIHGFQAAADPTIRPGTNGLFYYSGLAFNRGTNAASTVFVARFIDNNNKENGDPTHTNGSLTNLAPTDPIQYLGTVAVQSGTATHFLDKPWIATDIPRGSATCQIPFTKSDGTQGTQKIPAGRVFLSYSSFEGTTGSEIMFTYSSDCGATWSRPAQLSQSGTLNQGSIVVVAPTYDEDGDNDSDPEDAIVYVAWRRFNASGKSDAIMIAKSSNGGESFAKAVAAVNFPSSCGAFPQGIGCAFDQGETGTEFRSNAYPAMTADDFGRVYLAWSQRQASGDGRIIMQVSADGQNWSAAPALVDSGAVSDDYGNPFGTISGRGHQLMPTLSFIAGKVTMTYYDQRQDHTLGIFTPKTDLTGYTEVRQLMGELIGSPASNLVFNSVINDAAPPLVSQRHTIDIQGAQASTLAAGNLSVPAFSSFRISRYAMGLNPNDALNSGQVEQLQVSPPNLPMFALGTEPFEGDYIDIAPAPAYVLQNGAWKFNTSTTSLPVFHTTWTDNRDVKPPANGDWTQYVPPFSLSNPSGAVHASLFDPTQNVPACVLNVNDGFTATRDQNIYTSIIAPGLVVGSLGNSKTLGFLPSNPAQLLQRAFAVTARNTTPIQRSFRISVGNQPALSNGAPDPAGQASLLQNSLQTSLDVTISPNTSVARAVFVQSANPTASITINVQEINAPGGTLVSGGLAGSVTLNPDPNAPAIQDPDSFGFANPSISGSEVHNPVIGTPSLVVPPVGNSSVLAPAITNPAITNPAITNPAITNPAITNPALLTSLNPAITNPAITNPAITNPAITNPAITNPAITNTSITDASYPLTNTGNTTTSYAVKLFQRAPLPAGVNLQLIVVKQYLTPIANGCDLAQSTQNIVVADVPSPVFTPAATLGDPNLPDPAITNATIALAPGETGQIILRANVGNILDMQNLVLNNVTPVGVAHPSNTGAAFPPATLTILSVTLPDGVAGVPYSAQVNVFGGVGADTSSISSGALPPGLNVDPATGIISGKPGASGTFSFTFQAADSSTPPVVTTQNLSIRIAAPLLVTTPSLSDAIVGTPYSLTLNSTGGLGNTTWTVVSGSLPSGLSLSSAGVLNGTPDTVNTAGTPVTIQVQDSGSPAQFITLGGTIHVAPLLSIATQTGPLPDAIVGQAYNFSFTSNGGLSPITWSVTSGSLPTGLTLSPSGAITGTPTAGGSFSFTIQAGDGSSPTQTISINVSVRSATPLVISTPAGAISDAIAGTAYNFAFQSTGGTPTLGWTIISGALPNGLALSSAGVITGMVAVANTTPTSFTLQAQDGGSPAQTKTVVCTIRVAPQLSLSTPGGMLPDAVTNAPYSFAIQSGGGIAPDTWSVASGALPAGLGLSASGVISGTPTVANIAGSVFTIQLQDSSNPTKQTISQAFSIRVGTPLTISTPGGALAGGIQGLAYNFNLQGGGGLGPLMWAQTGGQLPPGLLLNATGLISGTPTATGTYSFTAGLVDSSNPTRQAASVALSITIAAPMAITTPSGALHNALYKSPYSQILSSSGGTAPVVWTIAGGQLPPGMTLSVGGVIGGTPTSTGTFSFAVRATDSGASPQTATASYTISVALYLKVQFIVQPTNTAVGATITPAVRVRLTDNLGGAVSGAVVKMTIEFCSSGTTLGGQTTQSTGADGTATFANLTVSRPGYYLELVATVTSPTTGARAESAPFNVR